MARDILVHEVGPRDGLQNEPRVVPTRDKLRLVRALADAGLRQIEATSLVSPEWIPALADAGEVLAALPAREKLSYTVLVPNGRGLQRLFRTLDSAPDRSVAIDAAVFLSASETHNRKNLNRTIDETFQTLEGVLPCATGRGLRVRGYVSMAWSCPYEGPIGIDAVVRVTTRLLAMGCYQVSLGDTVGVGMPNRTRALLDRLLGCARPEQLALHMHDTHGTALANVLIGLEAGLSTFDASIGGLGGCPYAPGASGNVATEDLVYLLHGMGYTTGIDWGSLVAAGQIAESIVGRLLPSKALKAAKHPCAYESRA